MTIEDEIADLEQKLQTARNRLNPKPSNRPIGMANSSNTSALHTLLLLADSQLPLGSFAFSSGLESYLAHHRPSPLSASQLPSFYNFLRLSLSTLSSTALPYVLNAYRYPNTLEDLDNDFDASTPCTVARRASVAQGKALIGVWDRSYRQHHKGSLDHVESVKVLSSFHKSLRHGGIQGVEWQSNGHLAPLWGIVTLVLNVPLYESAYLFLFSHARTVLGAAVRSSVMGPYQAQAVLASSDLQNQINDLVQEKWDRKIEDAGQSVPVMDLWVGRHEKLYSRIFNS
ncbi:urease accessory protein UreF [Patellaria atrata CBS 101060]|uniref:Urease accessory protein UreF n=1 Tax=Patellaria atrata CBS 101060 TaxID=1346257 RepID=A0A9P4VU94_9PEZI|nr:urease accessory protein UreF [Patellaria atrata CBS 101060]